MQHCIILNANKAVGCGSFRRFSNLDKCRPEAANDVISGAAVDNVGMDVCVQFGYSRSNSFRDIRGAHFVSNERTTEQNEAHSNSAKRGPPCQSYELCSVSIAWLPDV